MPTSSTFVQRRCFKTDLSTCCCESLSNLGSWPLFCFCVSRSGKTADQAVSVGKVMVMNKPDETVLNCVVMSCMIWYDLRLVDWNRCPPAHFQSSLCLCADPVCVRTRGWACARAVELSKGLTRPFPPHVIHLGSGFSGPEAYSSSCLGNPCSPLCSNFLLHLLEKKLLIYPSGGLSIKLDVSMCTWDLVNKRSLDWITCDLR